VGSGGLDKSKNLCYDFQNGTERIGMELKKIELEEIVGTVYQPRIQEDPEVDELVESILKNGIIVLLLMVPVSQSLRVIKRDISGTRQV